ncbi:MAG: ABC transporter ATP-binding protein [Alphaproteobacteria bacterium]
MTQDQPTPRLELRDVQKSFDEVEAVKGSSLSVERGEFLSLLGPSGCGKSTTLSMIAGFLTPDSGEIRVDGTVVNNIPPQKRRIGLVFQDYAIFSRLTVRQNLAFGLEAQKVEKAERERRIGEISEKLDLQQMLTRRGGSLNMSEMQRVAIARVLVTQPELLLLDEPMSNLDASLRASLRGELKQIQKDLEQTVLYVTHDQVEAMSMSDRIAVMHGGSLLQTGSPEEIYNRPVNRFIAEFIGDPPINIIDCDVTVSGGKIAVKTAMLDAAELGAGNSSPGRHLLGIRPHDVILATEPAAGTSPSVVRFVENLGSEHILHIDHGDDIIAAVAEPHFAGVGDTVHFSFNMLRAHLIDRESGDVAVVDRSPGQSGRRTA